MRYMDSAEAGWAIPAPRPEGFARGHAIGPANDAISSLRYMQRGAKIQMIAE